MYLSEHEPMLVFPAKKPKWIEIPKNFQEVRTCRIAIPILVSVCTVSSPACYLSAITFHFSKCKRGMAGIILCFPIKLKMCFNIRNVEKTKDNYLKVNAFALLCIQTRDAANSIFCINMTLCDAIKDVIKQKCMRIKDSVSQWLLHGRGTDFLSLRCGWKGLPCYH